MDWLRISLATALLLAGVACGGSSDGDDGVLVTSRTQTLTAHACPAAKSFRPPWVVGLPESTARKRLRDAGVHVRAFPTASESVPRGVVARQFPPRYQKVCRGWQVWLYVSSGP